MGELFLVTFIVLLIVAGSIIYAGIVITSQQTVKIVERLGKFHRIAQPGFSLRIPVLDRVVATLDLRVQSLDADLDTKSRDNVFVTAQVSTQYRIDPQQTAQAYYELSDPERQIQAYIADAIRSALPQMELDQIFEKKDDVARNVQKNLAEGMMGFGIIIVNTLITGIDPARDVKDAMNNINAAQRQRIAAQEIAEADRIKVVTRAQGEAERQKLEGKGIADQRQAIVDGLAASFKQLEEHGMDEQEVLNLLMLNQYMDTLQRLGEHGKTSTIMLNGTPGAMGDLRQQVMEAIVGGKTAVQDN
ncbi:MAG: SPFH domain-containing protein [Coriobacteriia bacterium]|nr:SPFH domain-containing protein [Coriobacteriia bacterium]MCL2870230.1 SPFH domain-containing protein [Coriobacteriia bacterium]